MSLNDSLVVVVDGAGVGQRKRPPTSLKDLLVDVVGGIGVGWRKKTANESLRLVGGGGGMRWHSRAKKKPPTSH